MNFLGDDTELLYDLIAQPGPLLSRGPMPIDYSYFEAFKGCRILITGAAGSIGAVLAKELLASRPAGLVLMDISAAALKSLNLNRDGHPHSTKVSLIHGDILNRRLVKEIIRQQKIDIVFHAAALKHVPLLENDAASALRINALGSLVIAEESAAARVEVCVLLSTDKAVNPVNVLGKSKLLAERIFASSAAVDGRTRFCSVRLGNVLGSSGSVVPLFLRQALSGADLTVTHRDVSRYFITHYEAVGFIALGAALGRDGEVLIPQIEQPTKIIELANQLCSTLGIDAEIHITSLRPGDKLTETLHDGTALPNDQRRVWRENGRPLSKGCLMELRAALQECEETSADDALTLMDGCLVPARETCALAAAN